MAKSDARRIVDDFGRRVGELRRERGWTQLDLAERWGVSLGYVQLVEHGRENLTIESLALLAGVLRVQPMELLRSPRSRARRRPGRPRKA
jgi:HTH-type transcriptional regulator, competence development regulator